jgi:hypothetical protein
MRFELTIAPDRDQGNAAVLTVEAPNWLAALQRALTQLGEQQIPRGKAVCEVKEDGAILVRNAVDGRRFHIRPVVPKAAAKPEPPPQTAPERPQEARQTPFGTMTYLEAELSNLRVPGGAQPLHPGAKKAPVTGGHPCMLFDKEEIARRIKAHEEDLRKAQERHDSAPPVMVSQLEKTSERKVRFIRVVDVDPPAHDTLTSLKVDLDELRRSSQAKARQGPMGKSPPKGFEWLQEPLEAALNASRSAEETADRTLRLALAALPSRSAVILLRRGEETVLAPVATLGQRGEGATAGRLEAKGTPLELPLLCGMSMVLDNSPDATLHARQLATWFGFQPRTVLVASITNGIRTLGVLLLADALGSDRYTATDLAAANYLAARVFADLEYWHSAAAS